MKIFTRDRQIVSSPQIDEIEEAIVRFFNQIVASAEEIPRVIIFKESLDSEDVWNISVSTFMKNCRNLWFCISSF